MDEPRSANVAKSEPAARCPLCDRPRDPHFRPFCSRRCRDQDLLRWLDGSYAIPAVDADDEAEEQR